MMGGDVNTEDSSETDQLCKTKARSEGRRKQELAYFNEKVPKRKLIIFLNMQKSFEKRQE